MLRVVQRTVANGGDNLAHNEERIAIQIVRCSAGHDHRTGQMEARHDNGQQGSAPFVDTEANRDTEESVNL